MKREVKAHIEVPARDGRALCGKPAQKVRACPACLSRRASMVLVHVQSPKGGEGAGSLCGRDLVVPGDGDVDGAGTDQVKLFKARFVRGVPPPAYVSADAARDIIRGSVSGRAAAVPMCPACCVNLGRLDEAESMRRAGKPDRGALSVARSVAAMQPGLIMGEDED